MQLPEGFADQLTDEAASKGSSSLKILGTTAVGLLLGMPQEVRDELYLWVVRQAWDGPDDLTPEGIWSAMIEFAVKDPNVTADVTGKIEKINRPPSPSVSRMIGPDDVPPRGRQPRGPIDPIERGQGSAQMDK